MTTTHTAQVADALARISDAAPLEVQWDLEEAANLIQATFVVRRWLGCPLAVARDAAKAVMARKGR